MCVKGFIILIDSVLGVANQILDEQKYLLTYKCSQDHLELFFNAVRRTAWNNNPTAKVFTAAFRKIISHCGALTVSKHGNCSVLEDEDTKLLRCALDGYVPPVTEHSESNDDSSLSAGNLAALDHNKKDGAPCRKCCSLYSRLGNTEIASPG